MLHPVYVLAMQTIVQWTSWFWVSNQADLSLPAVQCVFFKYDC